MKVLVAGGAGYIGSHTVVELANKGYEVVIADNFSNSKPSVVERLSKIVQTEIECERIDLCDQKSVRNLFDRHHFDAVMHFAGFKAVGESVRMPLKYYINNLVSTFNLCNEASDHDVASFIFSSSATVYGKSDRMPVSENSALHPNNPYGHTKVMIEQILKDWVLSNNRIKVICLRYFNPVGAHQSKMIGEDPFGLPNNLLPYISQVAAGKLEKVQIYGNDYDTKDGTGVRDYIHVMDLALGHISALEKISHLDSWEVFNLGTGKAYSVMEVIHKFEKISGKPIPYNIVARREGDVAVCFADPSKANIKLGWKAKKNLDIAIHDLWEWQKYINQYVI